MKKKISEVLSENFQFLVVNFSIYLNQRAFVMVRFMTLQLTCHCTGDKYVFD